MQIFKKSIERLGEFQDGIYNVTENSLQIYETTSLKRMDGRISY